MSDCEEHVEDTSDLIGTSSDDSTDSSQETEDDIPTKTYGSVTISLIKDEIKNQQVDVIVNSTSSSLDLNQGVASRALLEAAGDTIQQECKDNYPNGVSEMDIARSKGGNLQCSQIYHLSLQKWQGDRNKEVLKKLVRKCLNQASSASLSSIAIPALGTGLLNYDRDMVASCMFSCVKHFESRNTTTTLKDVRFIIYPSDTTTYQAFLRRINKQRISPDVGERVIQMAKVGQMEVKLVTGQLTNQECEVVMTTCTRKLDLSKGALSQSVAEAAGSSLQAECLSKYSGGIKHGEVAVLSPGTMSCKKIYCGAVPRFDKPTEGTETPRQLLTKLVTACLKEASNDHLQSISFPTLGTGYLMYPPDVSASLMFKAIKEFSTNNSNSSIRTVIVVIHSTPSTISKLLEPFKNAHREIISSPKKPIPVPKGVIVGKSRTISSAKVQSRLSKEDMNLLDNMVRRPSSARSFIRIQKETVPVLPPRIPTPKPPLEQEESSKVEDDDEEDLQSAGAMAVPARNTPAFCMHMYQHEIYPPAYWTSYTNNRTIKQWKIKEQGKPGYKLVDVPDSMFKSIVKVVDGTWQQAKVGQGRDALGLSSLGYTSMKVVKVQRIENLKLYESYRQKQQNLFHKAGEGPMFKKLSSIQARFGNPKTESFLDDSLKEYLYDEVNEGYFFHGTKDKNVEGVIKDGIDPRLAQGQAVFGQGIYMAESSTKADQYTDERGEGKRRKNDLKMFLVRCSLGSICLMKSVQKFRRPPCCVSDCLRDDCSHDNRYDSVVEEEAYIFREFVVYDMGQSYPEYLITYNRV